MYYAIAAVVIAVLMAAVYLLTPRPKGENAKPNLLEDFNITTNSNTRCVPIVFGTCKITPNVLWYGDLRSDAIWA